ncbi:MAG: hypothetical protein HY047_20800 [Acidobacteria bacterium]|nr:hypothetical protein [Acidobacteriota bacterium]
MSSVRPFDAEARAQTAEWLAAWARMGPILEARRVSELRQLTEADSARIAVELLWPLVPAGHGDDGEGLRALQDVLRRLAERS